MSTSEHAFCVLAYEESPHLETCIASLLAQTVPSQVVLVTSTPSTFIEELAVKYELPIQVNRHHKGIGSDWTFAYRSSPARYVTLAHQDDLYLPGYTERCLQRLSQERETLIVFTDYCEKVGNRLRKTNLNLTIKRLVLSVAFAFHKTHIQSRFRKKGILRLGSSIPCPSVMYHKVQIGDFSFSDDYHVNLDWEAWLRLCDREGSFAWVREPLLIHRIHEGSQTSLGIQENLRSEEDRRLFEQIWPKPIAAILHRLYAYSYVSNQSE